MTFFHEVVKPRLAGEEQSSWTLTSAYVGQKRNLLDYVELNLRIVAVMKSFEQYVKYLVELVSSSGFEQIVSDDSASHCLITALPSPVRKVKNKKDQLYNDIISFFSFVFCLL